MDTSPNQNILPMRGTVERETRRKALAARATRSVVEALQHPPTFPPGAIGSVALPHELMGYSSIGEYVSQSYHEQFDPPPKDAA